MKEKAKMVFAGIGIYLFGIILAIVFFIMQLLKQIKIMHSERFPHYKCGKIFVANHPSVIDPWIVAVLFAKAYLKNPFKYAPMIVADANNFCKSKYWSWMCSIMISVNRDDKHSAGFCFRKMQDALSKGRNIIIFPEGGRTFRGTDFLISHTGKKIRILSGGTALLVKKTRAKLVPIWIEGTDEFCPNSEKKLFTHFVFGKKITIKIGEILDFGGPKLMEIESREEIIQIIGNALLSLADEKQ
jgi:1-acyl-sn-glycerol-3-phosphate acyltransferase